MRRATRWAVVHSPCTATARAMILRWALWRGPQPSRFVPHPASVLNVNDHLASVFCVNDAYAYSEGGLAPPALRPASCCNPHPSPAAANISRYQCSTPSVQVLKQTHLNSPHSPGYHFPASALVKIIHLVLIPKTLIFFLYTNFVIYLATFGHGY